MILAAVAAGGEEPLVREKIEAADHLARHGKPITTRLKEWAFSGLTPPEQEATTYTPASASPVVVAAAAVPAPVGKPEAEVVKEKKGWWS